MADTILQIYGTTPGVGATNALAFVDVPQSGRVRKIRLVPYVWGFVAIDFAYMVEISTLPTNRFFNNGDFGNVMGRFSVNTDGTTSGQTSSFSQEITGLDFRITVGLRLFMHTFFSSVPGTADDIMVDLYIDT